jgi:hypothetical protein
MGLTRSVSVAHFLFSSIIRHELRHKLHSLLLTKLTDMNPRRRDMSGSLERSVRFSARCAFFLRQGGAKR